MKAEVGIGSKIIVFTQFIRQAEELYKVLKEELGPIVALITSKTSDRDSIFKAFARVCIRLSWRPQSLMRVLMCRMRMWR